jgi:hypothetical protein
VFFYYYLTFFVDDNCNMCIMGISKCNRWMKEQAISTSSVCVQEEEPCLFLTEKIHARVQSISNGQILRICCTLNMRETKT